MTIFQHPVRYDAICEPGICPIGLKMFKYSVDGFVAMLIPAIAGFSFQITVRMS